jgi:transposase InsO family protein
MIKSTKATVWIDFLYECVISRYGCVGQVITDNGELNSELELAMEQRYRIQLSFTTAYHPQGNAPVERGHMPLRNSLERTVFQRVADSIETEDLHELKKNWMDHFYAMLWADRITVKRTTGVCSLYIDVW